MLLVNDCQHILGRGVIIIIRSIIIIIIVIIILPGVLEHGLHQPSDRRMAFLASKSDISPSSDVYLLQMKTLFCESVLGYQIKLRIVLF